MNEAQQIIGAYVRRLREQQGFSLESLAAKAGISYQYLSGIETGKENFSLQVLEALATALQVPVKALVVGAYEGGVNDKPPLLEARFFRPQVPLPEGLGVSHLQAAAQRTQMILHRMNRNLVVEVGLTLRSLIQGNNFSGLVSNIFTNALDECSPYKHNHEQKYPDLLYPAGNNGKGIGLEVKATVNIGKGGESHNGHSGWHLIACYNFLESSDIQFVHLMLAYLHGHLHKNTDWVYVGSKVKAETGSRRTETYTTNLQGTTKLRDGSVYVDENKVSFRRWRQEREGTIPSWSIFAT